MRNIFSVLILIVAVGLQAGCSNQDSTFAFTASAAAQATSAQSSSGKGGWAEALSFDGNMRLAADYQRLCATGKPAANCETLRNLLIAGTSTTLELIERSRDQRGTDQALAALAFPDEPDLFIAACRILGNFPQTAGIVEKVLPQLLENRYVEIQRMAATLLKATPDTGAAEAASLWLHNHTGLGVESDLRIYEDYPDFPPHYAAIGFPKYPGAEWFSPADSDRSIGWSTSDDAAAVTRWFTESLKAEAMDPTQWQRYQTDQVMQQFDQSRAVRMQQLMEKAFKGDKAAMAEYEKLAKELDSASNALEAAAEKAVTKMTLPSALAAKARWIVAKRKGARVSTVVVVYPLSDLRRTAIQHGWDLTDYPSAWPVNDDVN
jgi:hypothetical protein